MVDGKEDFDDRPGRQDVAVEEVGEGEGARHHGHWEEDGQEGEGARRYGRREEVRQDSVGG